MHKLTALAAVAALSMGASVASAGTLDDVKAAGTLKCGVSTGLLGFSAQDENNRWVGLDADYCHALAAAVLGDSEAVEFLPLSAKERFTALQSGEVDVLSRNTTWTFSRDVELGLTFVGVNYYDGQGFMVAKDLGVKSATELDGAPVCIQPGTTTELNLADYFARHNMKYEAVVTETDDVARQAYQEGRCKVYTTDKSGLAAQLPQLENPDAHMILPETISKEPLGPAVRQGDDQWADIARWTLNATVAAEELGVTSENVEDMKGSDNPEIKRLLGVEGDLATKLGLEADAFAQAIAAEGNYGQMYARSVGPDSPLGLARGINAQWTDGGLMYAAPFR
jgi:general L-amino acid transport system substrate-binding protein